MMLKDGQGRQVVWHEWMDNNPSWQLRKTHSLFVAIDGTQEIPVDEAIVSQGDDLIPSREFVAQRFKDAGYDYPFTYYPKAEYSWVSCNVQHSYGSWLNSSRATFSIAGRNVSEIEYNKFSEFYARVNGYGTLLGKRYGSDGVRVLKWSQVLEVIGEGKVVTTESLEKMQSKDESRPRIIPGDTVEVTLGKKKILGTIKSISSKVSVVRQDGVKGNYPYNCVVRVEGTAYNEELAAKIDPTITAAFQKASDVNRIYRAKTEKMDLNFPMFPKKDERVIEKAGVVSCVCPVCGWRMASFHDENEMLCNFCRIRGIILNQKDGEVSLLMLRWPAKNRFCIKEAACCNNCGLFEFSYGRQGKRTTGYCMASNQCVQGFNTCDIWFPRDIKTYESNMRQHTTNLHFGVSDTRNTGRHDIRDTVYTEDDHKAEQKRAEDAKSAYTHAYAKFWEDLRKEALNVPLCEDPTPEITAEWQKKLDDPC